jgi:hypothetical protein
MPRINAYYFLFQPVMILVLLLGGHGIVAENLRSLKKKEGGSRGGKPTKGGEDTVNVCNVGTVCSDFTATVSISAFCIDFDGEANEHGNYEYQCVVIESCDCIGTWQLASMAMLPEAIIGPSCLNSPCPSTEAAP